MSMIQQLLASFSAATSAIVSYLPLSTNLSDTKGLTWTAAGSATVTGGKLPLNGTNQNISTPNNVVFDFAAGDFCVEAVVNIDSTGTGGGAVLAKWSSGQYSFFCGVNASNKLAMYYYNVGGTGVYPVGTATVPTNVDVHLAWYRVGGIGYVAINGVVESLGAISAIRTTNTTINIGSDSESNNFLKSSGVRHVTVHKGYSPYGAATFLPWPSVRMLLHADGADATTATYDNSIYTRAMTQAGASELDTAQSVFGGSSMYIPASTSGWTTPGDTALDMRSGAFQIDWRHRLATGIANDTDSELDTVLAMVDGSSWSYEWAVIIHRTYIRFYFGTRGSNNKTLRFFLPAGYDLSIMGGTWVALSIGRDTAGRWGAWIDGARCPDYQQGILGAGESYNARVNGAILTDTTDLGDSVGRTLSVGKFGPFSGLARTKHIDELRYVVGYCRDVTSNYTPSALPFPNNGEFPSGGTDTFATNTIANYTSYSDSGGTWNISGGILECTAGNQAVLIRNGVSFVNGEISCNILEAPDAGLVLRFQNNSNYYLCVIHDASSGSANLLYLFKRVGGSFTQLSTASISFVRGTSHTVAFRANGTTLEIDFDGVNKISTTDSAISATGGAGMRGYGGGNKFDSFTWP